MKIPAKVGVTVFGVDLSGLSRQNQLLTLAFGSIASSVAFAYLQELVFLIDGTKHGFISLLTAMTFAICGFIECVATNDLQRKASLKEYAQLSVFTMGGMYLTNWSLTYLNYPTRVMFKSSKVIPVMFVGAILQGKRYSGLEYLGAFILVGGITIFTLGDASESPKFNMAGIFLISLGVLFDAITCNFEEKRFFHLRKCSQAEVMTYASLFGCIWALFPLIASGDLGPCIQHAILNPQVVTWTAAFSTLGYASSILILVFIKHFGATEAEVVKSCRKVFTIVFSFILVSKPISAMHILGGFLFVVSIVLSIWVKSNRPYKPVSKTLPVKASDSFNEESK